MDLKITLKIPQRDNEDWHVSTSSNMMDTSPRITSHSTILFYVFSQCGHLVF